ncbi:MAG TPA: trypsin-like serine protease [Polyangiaceae bacterium]|nr:trypsin-like serine protease [Polyangiaceae bacterium]
MRSRKTGYWILCGLLLSSLGACSGQGMEESDSKSGEIIRATSNGGRDQVVMLYGVLGNGTHLFCSGSYYAPRVVLTAAHCLPPNLYQLFIYYGDDLQQDLPELTSDGFIGLRPPPIGAPSHWSQADSWQKHPSYDANLNSADMGAVFLDRKPPFDPLPLYRSRVSSGLQVTLSGWGSNATPTPTTGTGYGVQRTGRTVTLGSPTAADYHPDDPNPGMLDPAVRQTVLKTSGVAPNSSDCFGDSGSPIILNQFGQDYVAGVFYWTGLSCEEYNLSTRIDPFLPFLDLSYKRGGQDVLKPTFACVTPNPQGSLTAIFGYQNDNGVGISVPYGSKNASARDTSGLRPTRFDVGLHPFAFGVDFSAGQTASWTLAPDNNPSVTLNANSSSPRCTDAQAVDSGCVLQCSAQLRSGCPRVEESDNCVAFCSDAGHFIADAIPECNDERVSWQNCVAATAPGSANWTCNFEDEIGIFGNGPQPVACTDLQNAYINCLFGG